MRPFTVRRHTLLLIASFVWLAAGVNIVIVYRPSTKRA